MCPACTTSPFISRKHTHPERSCATRTTTVVGPVVIRPLETVVVALSGTFRGVQPSSNVSKANRKERCVQAMNRRMFLAPVIDAFMLLEIVVLELPILRRWRGAQWRRGLVWQPR